ncbi:MAG: hypothetical protein PHE77_00605 [Candidatus Pacebacteria bacterium]|nr:hypothetical protein [Candidatus Paceibacterota bacterium]
MGIARKEKEKIAEELQAKSNAWFNNHSQEEQEEELKPRPSAGWLAKVKAVRQPGWPLRQ